MLGVQRDHAIDVLGHAGGGCTRRAGRRDDDVGESRERRVFGRREERRRVRAGRGRLGERDVDVLAVELVSRKRKRARQADRAEHLEGVSSRLGHKSPFLIRSAMCSAARAASAMIVCVGFFSDADGNTLPSTT